MAKRYYLETITREYFDNPEERENHIKDHAPMPFDTKVELLKTGEFHDSLEGDTVDITLKEEE